LVRWLINSFISGYLAIILITWFVHHSVGRWVDGWVDRIEAYLEANIVCVLIYGREIFQE